MLTLKAAAKRDSLNRSMAPLYLLGTESWRSVDAICSVPLRKSGKLKFLTKKTIDVVPCFVIIKTFSVISTIGCFKRGTLYRVSGHSCVT